MKKITIVFLFSSFSVFAQNSDTSCDILLKINKLLQHEHFSPRPINDSLSAYLFDELLDELDPSRIFFLKFCGDRPGLDLYLRYPGKTDGWCSGRQGGGGGPRAAVFVFGTDIMGPCNP